MLLQQNMCGSYWSSFIGRDEEGVGGRRIEAFQTSLEWKYDG